MAKKKAQVRQRRLWVAVNRHGRLVAAGLLVAIIVAGTVLAGRGNLFASQKRHPSEGGTSKEALTPQGLADLTHPAKEYIYAGGRLVATEEPPVHHAMTVGVFRPATGTGSNYFYLSNDNSNVNIITPLGGRVTSGWSATGTAMGLGPSASSGRAVPPTHFT